MSEFGGLWKHEETQHALKKWHNSQLVDCSHYTEEERRVVSKALKAQSLSLDQAQLVQTNCFGKKPKKTLEHILTHENMHGQHNKLTAYTSMYKHSYHQSSY